MANIVPDGIDQITGQSRAVTSADSLVDTSGNALGDVRVLIEKKEITSAATTLTFSGLDGDNDGIYELDYYLVMGASGSLCNYYLNPNGLTTNQPGAIMQLSSIYAFSAVSRWQLALTTTGADRIWGFAKIWAQSTGPSSTATVKQFQSEFSLGNTLTSGGVPINKGAGTWSVSTNITSLVVESSIASNIGVGSTFTLYKRPI